MYSISCSLVYTALSHLIQLFVAFFLIDVLKCVFNVSSLCFHMLNVFYWDQQTNSCCSAAASGDHFKLNDG